MTYEKDAKRLTKRINAIRDALVESKTIEDVMAVINKQNGSIQVDYIVKNARKKVVSGEICFSSSNDDDPMIIYRDKGSLFATNAKDLPSFKLPPDTVALIKELFQ